MRISTANAYEASVNSLQKRQQALSEAQLQLTSGKRVLRPSDDPAAAARAERALAQLGRTEAQQRALGASRDATQLTEAALGDAGELLQRVREHLLASGNGTVTDADRRVAAEAIRGLRNDLFAVANRGDGAGRYLFGGQGSDTQPFVDTNAGVIYVAARGELLGATGDGTPLSVDGQAAWLQTPDPANPGGQLSVFDVLDRAVTELLTPGRPNTAVAQTVRDGLRDLDATAASLSGARSRAGEALNRIDGLDARLAQIKVDAQRQRSDAEDLDMVAAISDFQNRQTGYDAALKTYSIVQKMSLFDYLR